MKEIMAEETFQPESDFLVSEFLRTGVVEAALPIARLGVDPSRLNIYDLGMLEGEDGEIAQALARVEVVDPYYKEQTSHLELPYKVLETTVPDEVIADALLITLAKAEAVKSEHPRLKARLNKFEDTILDNVLDKVGGFLARTGGKKVMAAVSGLALLVTSCGTAVASGPNTLTPERPTITETYYPPATSEPTATAEATETSIPTQATATEVAPTQTSEPTPTTEAPKVEEHDLNPAYTETVSQKFMGVQINAELITDESLDSEIKKVTVPKNIYAEFIARTIFKVWREKGEEVQTEIATEDDFKAFMELWKKAQESGDPTDWEKVQLTIWANDLNDGNGYVQKQETIWPMYEGETPEGVRGINEMNIAFVRSSMVHNITTLNELDQGLGTNIDGESLYVYLGQALGNYPSRLTQTTAETCSAVPWWLIRNSGRPVTGYMSEDKALTKLLLNNGYIVYPNNT